MTGWALIGDVRSVTCRHVYQHAHTDTHTHAHTQAYTHAHTHAHPHAHTHMHTHTHAHTHHNRVYKNSLLTLSREKVLVTANAHPASNALLIMAELVVGVAEASPKGFSNLSPTISTLMSTRSTGVKKFGSLGVASTYNPCKDWGGELTPSIPPLGHTPSHLEVSMHVPSSLLPIVDRLHSRVGIARQIPSTEDVWFT